jgi:hypothetical protein
MPITSADIYPLARWLRALIPTPLQRWTGEPSLPEERDRLADLCLEVLQDAFEGTEDDDENAEMIGQMTILSEALAGFVTGWGCRYGNLDDDVDHAQLALGGGVHKPGCISSRLARPSLWWRSPTSLAGCAPWRCRSWGRTMAESTMDGRLAHLGATERNARYAATTARRFLFQCSASAITPPFSRFHGFSMGKSWRKELAPTKGGHRTLGSEASTGKIWEPFTGYRSYRPAGPHTGTWNHSPHIPRPQRPQPATMRLAEASAPGDPPAHRRSPPLGRRHRPKTSPEARARQILVLCSGERSHQRRLS